MDDLIAALEAGPGSRELSDRVLVAVGYRKTSCYGWTRPDGSWPENPSLDPSRNLQDAVDVVPAFMGWDIEKENESEFMAGVSNGQPELGPLCNGWASAPTPALALCIAILRSKGDNHEP